MCVRYDGFRFSLYPRVQAETSDILSLIRRLAVTVLLCTSEYILSSRDLCRNWPEMFPTGKKSLLLDLNIKNIYGEQP